MSAYVLISAAALTFCALIGLGALFAPKWAQGVVRLVPDPAPERPGGFSEFRATYGGLLFMLHITALIILLRVNNPVVLLAIMPISAGWFGAGLGRTVSYLADGPDNRAPGMIPIWIAVEFALALAIAAPVLHLG
ncbi:MAG: hypothetical protein CME84_06950 [Henriciella sp.]|jgi:hypothetical protein|uniref:DUF4345 family protein n=1 Tax=Henriciella sp. TaxID=1968823 RepID=UPI000C108267|nr:DUF4345 family protein [Henriciella sp.]MAN73809.1 hypothetical protein [Henriciella sp.]MBF35514.1 hypothetical protein [Hyphomonadaceae bacterium]PHR82412.1 MAG: hypothetical protein COA64_01460 [Henriciella sp.]|tara:strand:+ start:64 stop:468 length:405 start_codon:yes stop_codon:yes gene_type:complete